MLYWSWIFPTFSDLAKELAWVSKKRISIIISTRLQSN